MNAAFNINSPWSCREATAIVYEQPLALPSPGKSLPSGNTPVAIKLDNDQYMIAVQDLEGDVAYYGILSADRFHDVSYHLAGVYTDSDSYTTALHRAYLNYSIYRSDDAINEL